MLAAVSALRPRLAFGLAAGVTRAGAAQGQMRGFHGSKPVCAVHGSGCDGNHGSDPKLKKELDEMVSKEHLKALEELHGTHPEMEDVLARNKAWVARMNEEDPTFFDKLSPQKPDYLVLGCSDARLDVSRLMALPYGKVFVHRNVGNVVAPSDLNILSVIDFAVNYLKVPHIVVLGHYDCGAVRGSIARPTSGGLGIVENWLRNIRDVARLHKDELLQIKDSELRHRRLVELNVVEGCLNVFKTEAVQRRRFHTFEEDAYEFALPRIHGCVWDPKDGVLQKLPLPFKQELNDYREIYELYRNPESKDDGGSFWNPVKQNRMPSPEGDN